MTFVYCLLLFTAIFGLIGILQVARRRRIQISNASGLVKLTHAVDLEAFCNLMDPAEDAFLRANLPPPAYRKLRRERLLIAIQYVRAVSSNAVVLLALGEAVRRNPDPGIAAAGEQMVDSAIRLRLNSAVVLLNLWAAVALPKAKVPAAALVSRYQHLKALASHLGRLQSPAVAGRISAAL